MTEEERNEMLREHYARLAQNGVCGSEVMMFCIILILLFVFGCCPCKKIVTDNSSSHDSKDSVRIECRYEKETVYIHDTTYVPIPAQVSVNHTQGEPSHLENDFCTSDARIEPDGSLYHDLRTKKGDIPVEYDRPETTITESQKEEHTSSEVNNNSESNTVYVERDYTWWDKTRFYMLYFLAAAAGVHLFIRYRKPIFKYIKLILSKIR